MAERKTSWDDIPSIDNLTVDWDYKPENPLGKRQCARLKNKELQHLLGVKNIPAKVATSDVQYDGQVVDLGQKGIAVLLDKKIRTGLRAKVVLLLGREKIVSSAIPRCVEESAGWFRTGIQFVDLPRKSKEFISGLVTSNTLKQS